MSKNKYIAKAFLFVLFAGTLFSCQTEETTPDFSNKCYKRSMGPNVYGNEIEFAYAMAIQPYVGKLVSASVEASIAGEEGTWLEHRSYHAKLDGMDTAIVVGNPSVTEGTLTTVEYVVDTCAATLRYFYKIPKDAKGQDVSFNFSAVGSNGQIVTQSMGPYHIANMDMELDVNLTAQNCYLSIADMKAYNAAQAAEHPERIDLVYFFRNGNLDTAAINHSFVAPACKKYIPQNLTLPAGVENDTKIRDVGIKDAHLARLHLKNPPEAQPGIYIDDIDLQTIDLSNMPNWAFDLIANDGMWVATGDGKYHAYIYVNSANRGRAGATISMKRYTMY